MGLDITAHSRLKRAECSDDVDCDIHVRVYRNEDFPEQAEDLQTGCYSTLEGSRKASFCAGSYSGYNWWRDELAAMRNGQDFQELIWFSDCEGVIGPKTSAKLAGDFQKYVPVAQKRAGDGTMFWDKYQLWQSAFELASDGGCVRFH